MAALQTGVVQNVDEEGVVKMEFPPVKASKIQNLERLVKGLEKQVIGAENLKNKKINKVFRLLVAHHLAPRKIQKSNFKDEKEYLEYFVLINERALEYLIEFLKHLQKNGWTGNKLVEEYIRLSGDEKIVGIIQETPQTPLFVQPCTKAFLRFAERLDARLIPVEIERCAKLVDTKFKLSYDQVFDMQFFKKQFTKMGIELVASLELAESDYPFDSIVTFQEQLSQVMKRAIILRYSNNEAFSYIDSVISMMCFSLKNKCASLDKSDLERVCEKCQDKPYPLECEQRKSDPTRDLSASTATLIGKIATELEQMAVKHIQYIDRRFQKEFEQLINTIYNILLQYPAQRHYDGYFTDKRAYLLAICYQESFDSSAVKSPASNLLLGVAVEKVFSPSSSVADLDKWKKKFERVPQFEQSELVLKLEKAWHDMNLLERLSVLVKLPPNYVLRLCAETTLIDEEKKKDDNK